MKKNVKKYLLLVFETLSLVCSLFFARKDLLQVLVLN